MTPLFFVLVAIGLFAIGAITVLLHRSAVISLMGVEIMLNAANLALVAFSYMHGNLDGQVVAFFVMVVAAAEVVVGLALLVTLFRSRHTTSLDEFSLLKS